MLSSFFKPISPEEKLAQLERIAQQSTALAAKQRHAALVKRGPGRPKKVQSAHTLLSAAASLLPDHESVDDQAAAAEPTKRGKYNNWFASPYIHDILAAYHLLSHNAVTHLQRRFPKLPTEQEARFTSLSESTIRTWFDKDHKLLPRFQLVIDEGKSAAPRGTGPARALVGHAEVEGEIKRILTTMRGEAGAVVNIRVIRWVMEAVMKAKEPELLESLKLSNGFISEWARETMAWTWRRRTGAASKLPEDWRDQGIKMAQRIGVNMELYDIHPSLVINMDQTGLHLVPVDNHTYETSGSRDVKVIGGEDKRQITVCVASSLDGDLLPLQLVFTGKTTKCLPAATDAAVAAAVHLTFSENHWSSQETMQQYIAKVIVPFTQLKITEHQLKADAKVVLVLDVWAVVFQRQASKHILSIRSSELYQSASSC